MILFKHGKGSNTHRGVRTQRKGLKQNGKAQAQRYWIKYRGRGQTQVKGIRHRGLFKHRMICSDTGEVQTER